MIKTLKLQLLSFFLICLVLIQTLSAEKVEQLTPKGFVNDYADMLSQQEELTLENALRDVEKNLTIEIAVVTINSLEGDTVENFANNLFEKWKIGKKNDNGLLILIAKNEREIRIEVGYGLEPIITDGRAKRIIDELMVPNFKQGNYYVGIALAINEIVSIITKKDVNQVIYVEPQNPPFWATLILILFAIGFLVIMILAIRHFGIPGGRYSPYSSYGRYRGGSSSRWGSGRGGGFGGSGFGGFGGGRSGGGGASGRW
ncbi:MAG: TPM domain-containing protein [Candidatus Micrarchaeota archaeon]|nr:TPM domain-containing protein [Candidatus Micrarchaeota archaeon]